MATKVDLRRSHRAMMIVITVAILSLLAILAIAATSGIDKIFK